MLARRSALLIGAAGLARRPAGAAEPVELPIAVSSNSFVLGGVRIGEQAGLFTARGLRPRITVMDSGSAAMSALIGGSVHVAVLGPPEVLVARARGRDVLIFANLYQGLAGSLILGKPAAAKLSGSAAAPVDKRVAALNGLSIAVPSATSALLGPYRESAAALGVMPRFTYMAQGTMPAALERGAIDGFVASFPFAGVPLLQGTGVLWINGPGGDLPDAVAPASSSCLVTTAAYAAANKELIATVQGAVADIAAFIRDKRADAKAALAAAYNTLTPDAIDLSFGQQWQNWTKPVLTVADMRQEMKLLASSGGAQGLAGMDPASTLLPFAAKPRG